MDSIISDVRSSCLSLRTSASLWRKTRGVIMMWDLWLYLSVLIWRRYRLFYLQLFCSFQACDITGGLYLRIPQKVAMAQYLLVSTQSGFYTILRLKFVFFKCENKPLFVFLVGVPPWLGAAFPAGPAAARSRGLQSCVFLSSQSHRDWLRVLRLSVK